MTLPRYRAFESFSEQLRQVRIATAERRLVHSNLEIETIAAQVGLGTASRRSAVLRRDLQKAANELRAKPRTTRGERA